MPVATQASSSETGLTEIRAKKPVGPVLVWVSEKGEGRYLDERTLTLQSVAAGGASHRARLAGGCSWSSSCTGRRIEQVDEQHPPG